MWKLFSESSHLQSALYYTVIMTESLKYICWNMPQVSLKGGILQLAVGVVICVWK